MTRTWDLYSNLDRLKLLSIAELQDLLQDEEKIHGIIIASYKFQALEQHKQMMLASNHRLAEVNLSIRPYLNRGKLRLVEMYLELGRVSGDIGRKQNKLVAHQINLKPYIMQTLLRKRVGQTMDQSEKLLKRFMDQRLSAERFVDSYETLRKLYHIRLVKLEKMKDLFKPMRNTEKRPPSSLCCCAWSHQSEVHRLCSCIGSTLTSPNCRYPLTTYLVKTSHLPPLDYHLCHNNQWKPAATSLDPRHPEEEGICGKPSRGG
ncbi:vacuolar protein sorting-associated protein 37D-like [Sardina pilchardus]|uniref:vacuolar protein sorting-associated protein 37D-like n=1 Tax=Sardina pilchardus TaxID=27697 RepID=UPI002E120D98